jgi:1,4-dihydroxy-6-naphthoate synthase
LVFSEIEHAVGAGEYDAGLIIHESRFTYERKGLRKIVDLGEFWEGLTGLPLPLGGIVIRRSLPMEVKLSVNRVLRSSVEYAFTNRSASLPFVRAHAQEMSEDVMYGHIDLYVNGFSADLGEEGKRAVRTLLSKAEALGAAPRLRQGPFLSGD